MRLPKFEYLKPCTIEEVFSLLAQYDGKAQILAGGTDLLVKMKERKLKPQYLIGLKGVPSLDCLEYHEGTGLRIGALTTLGTVASSLLVQEKYPVLVSAINKMASAQVRSLGTVGGNLCNAAPSADTAPPLICLGAKVKLASAKGTRTVALEDFFKGPGLTVMKVGEILTEIQVPRPSPHSAGVYQKLSRTAVDLAIVGVAAFIRVEPKKGSCAEARIALGAVAPTPIRAKEAEAILQGKQPSDKLIEQAAQLAAGVACCITDVRGSEGYRTEMVGVLTRRAIKEAWEKARAS